MTKQAVNWNSVPGLLVMAVLTTVTLSCANGPIDEQAGVPGHAFTYPNLEALTEQSSHVIRGTVVEETTQERELGTRGGSIPYTITTLRVEESLKGQIVEEHLIVGQPVGGGEAAPPPPESEVIYFLNAIDPDAPRSVPPAPWDYTRSGGSQGMFLIKEGRISPLGPSDLETTTQYEDMPVGEFLTEIREAVRNGP